MSTLGTSTEPGNENVDQAAYEAEMVAKAEGAEEKALEKDSDQFEGLKEEEQLYAGKYKSPEDLEKAYKELESKLGQQTKEDTKEEPAAEPTIETQEEAKDLVETKGLDFTELNSEYAENGKLSDETYKKLADAGITKETADAYIAGQEALAQQNVAKLYNSVGGEEQFNAMVEWAAENLSEAEKNSFNKLVTSQDTAEFAVQGLYARYKTQAEPKLLDGNPTATSNGGYQSSREMMVDMSNPKYRTDPAYRKMVEMKVARSKF